MTTTTTTTNISDKGVKLLVKNYVMLQNFSHRLQLADSVFSPLSRLSSTTPPHPPTPRLQMLRIDREEMIDDVKTHSA